LIGPVSDSLIEYARLIGRHHWCSFGNDCEGVVRFKG
jgi:hypothetical protein